MANKHFGKFQPKRPLYFKGAPIPFQDIGDEFGVITLDDTKPTESALISHLHGMVGRFGVSALTEDDVAVKKKLGTDARSRARLAAARSMSQLRTDHPVKRAAAGNSLPPSVVEADPVEVPAAIPRPRGRGRPPGSKNKARVDDSGIPIPRTAEPVEAA